MAKFYTQLTDSLQAFISQQHIFFVATAPVEGRINLSPKGMNVFRCLDAKTVAYLDLTGSGNETAAHVLQNGRMTLMFCSFDETPMILRLYGRGRVVRPQHPDWLSLSAHFEPLPGVRQIFVLELDSVQTSCGFAVPEYEFKHDRPLLVEWADKLGQEGVAKYRREHNRVSIDGLSHAAFE
jgi:hypothetical protein